MRITCCTLIYIVTNHQWFTYTDLHIHFLASLFIPVGALRPTGSPCVGPPSFLHFCFLSSPLLFYILSALVLRNWGRTSEANVGRSTYRQKWVLTVTSANLVTTVHRVCDRADVTTTAANAIATSLHTYIHTYMRTYWRISYFPWIHNIVQMKKRIRNKP